MEGVGMLVALAGLHKLGDGPGLVATCRRDHPRVLGVMVLTHIGGSATHAALVRVCDGVGDECPRPLVVVEFIPLGDGKAEIARGAGLRPVFGGVGCPSRYRG